MDPSGILGIIGFAGQIITTAVKLGLAWKDAPQGVRDFMKELGSLKTILSETNANILCNPDFAAAFGGRHSTLLSHLHDPLSASDTNDLLSTCAGELKTLLLKLNKTASGHQIGWKRAKEVFLSDRTHAAVVDLQRRCDMLNRMVSIDSIALSASTNLEIRATRKEMQEKYLNEHETTVINWLSTGQWLLNSPEFQSWLQTDRQTLFCPGLPGAGKTIVTSIVVEHLHNRYEDDSSIGVAYIFCNFQRQDEQKLGNLLATMLQQLCHGKSPLPEEVKNLYRKHQKADTRPSRSEIVKTLRAVAARHTKVYILVDALDECQNDDSCRDNLIYEISSFASFGNINVFATSRHIPNITDQFKEDVKLEIQASQKDVERYLDNHLLNLNVPASIKSNSDLKEEIKTRIVQFLLARLHLQSLTGKMSAKAVKTALSWIICSVRPLSREELQEALAVEKGTTKIDEDNRPEIEDVISSNPLYDYAASNWGLHAKSSSYLCREMIDLFENHAKLHASFHLAWANDKLNNSPSCWYSTKRAQDLSGLHLAAYFGIVKVLDHVRSDLSNLEIAQSYLIDWRDSLGNLGINVQDDLGRTPLFYAVARGFEEFTKSLLEFPSADADKRDIYNRTPLAYASSLGNTTIVDCLINTGGVDVNSRDKAGRTPLHHAVRCGSDDVVKQLLKTSKIEPDLQDINGQTPLFFAIRFNRERVLKTLLETGKVAVDLRDNTGVAPLHLLVDRERDAEQLIMLRYLVEMGGADPNLKDNEGRTALFVAIARENLDLESYLTNKAKDDERLSVCNNTDQTSRTF
ncbi:ankyrin repeat protein [Colletotrichum incanum]|uniref:Ankyrin repeat protein n=1 Tax=Colletotrichum incanum TaxID=1573173 RepID=A0A166MUD8_COLIC|nr:ankyrin repeat protein [Colletotrichum incanum]